MHEIGLGGDGGQDFEFGVRGQDGAEAYFGDRFVNGYQYCRSSRSRHFYTLGVLSTRYVHLSPGSYTAIYSQHKDRGMVRS